MQTKIKYKIGDWVTYNPDNPYTNLHMPAALCQTENCGQILDIENGDGATSTALATILLKNNVKIELLVAELLPYCDIISKTWSCWIKDETQKRSKSTFIS